jgi:hypothetical protein
MEKRRPILSVRPYFDTALAMVQAVIFTAVAFLPFTMIGGTLVYLLFNLIGLGGFISAGAVYGFFLLVAIVGLPAVYFEVRKRAYQRTVYNFYDDYIDFQYFHFLINRRRGRLRYEDVTDITQQAGALQEQRRLTNIYLYAPALGYMRQRGIPGIIMPDLPLSRGYMNQIMNLFEAPGEEEPAAAEQSVPGQQAPEQASGQQAPGQQAPERQQAASPAGKQQPPPQAAADAPVETTTPAPPSTGAAAPADGK